MAAARPGIPITRFWRDCLTRFQAAIRRSGCLKADKIDVSSYVSRYEANVWSTGLTARIVHPSTHEEHTMITLHHLNQSRSKRIIWLLEEIGQPYQIKAYQRRADNHLAPDELKAVHPLGKAPVIELDGKVLAESGAITEWLISRFAAQTLAPPADGPEYAEYLQWIHFAESSAMLPLLLKMFVLRDGAQTNFLLDYAQHEMDKVIGHLNHSLADKRYLVADKLTGADIMMSFVVDILSNSGQLAQYPHLQRYAAQLASHSGWQRAQTLEHQYNLSANAG